MEAALEIVAPVAEVEVVVVDSLFSMNDVEATKMATLRMQSGREPIQSTKSSYGSEKLRQTRKAAGMLTCIYEAIGPQLTSTTFT